MKPAKRRKKTSIILASSISAIFLLFLIARFSGMLNYYKTPTTANRPNINQGDLIFASNLVKPEINDMICFQYYDSIHEKKEVIYVFRLVAKGGDKVEMRNGDLYVNSRPADRGLNLMQVYHVPIAMEDQIKTLAGIEEEEYDPNNYAEPDFQRMGPTSDSGRVFLTDEQLELLKKEKIPYNKEMLPAYGDDEIFNIYRHPWSPDSFGPYIVPQDHYFVMGDNRHGAMDSRYIGPIAVSKYTGTVINR
ncbi:MAG: S26 family signal peptidase [Pseudobacter sp.]|uniref:S26 family signal peptidase n=1 Tax=Pseudobacter sp. TaxID=2045420 RepID=UPI003F7D2209